MGILDNKKVIVTGGSRGIGLAIVRACMNEGAEVAATYCHSEDKLLKAASDINDTDRLKIFQMDVTDKNMVKKVSEEMIDSLGGVDVLVNNAGISDSALFMMMSDEKWDNVIQTNLYGCYHVLKQIVLPMLSQKKGSIVNISSVNGLVGSIGQSNYCASKAAIIGLTQSLSKELARKNVRVNAVAPGYIDTDMTNDLSEVQRQSFTNQIPMNRFGKAEEVAEVVVFLASDKASYITGQTIVIDGGMIC